MPKYSREMEEKIVALFEQGKRNSVISRELKIHRGSLPSRRKEWEKIKQEKEKPETEPEKLIQQGQNIDPQKYTRAPNNHRASPSQITELEKRISNLEESQRGSKPYLLKRRISKLEESQRGSNPSLLERRISELEEMRAELLESVESRLRDKDACKHIGKNGYCHCWSYSYDHVEKLEYLSLKGRAKYNGNIVYHVNVREHPLICSACQAYERRS